MLIGLVITAVALTLYIWLILPRLRRRAWWNDAASGVRAAYARLRALCGNSRTLAVAYAASSSASSTRRSSWTGRRCSAPRPPAASWWSWAR
jgi:hypothetical protein